MIPTGLKQPYAKRRVTLAWPVSNLQRVHSAQAQRRAARPAEKGGPPSPELAAASRQGQGRRCCPGDGFAAPRRNQPGLHLDTLGQEALAMTGTTAASFSIGTADGLLETEKNAGEPENTYILRPIFQQRRVTDGCGGGDLRDS